MKYPLEGIKILDLTRVLAGPYCTMILGDLGAEVIKVEGPEMKDETRAWGPPYVGGESAYYLCANRNKRAITIDLKSEKGKEVFKKLAAESDVIIQNFKNGTLDRLGLGYDAIKKINEKIIFASITGFGSSGPYKDLPGYDFIMQAMGGLMSITGNRNSGPMKVGVPIADVLTGLYTAIGILAAIREREYSGEGQKIDMALFDSQIASLVNVASNYLVTGKIPEPVGNEHPNIVPYQIFETMDQDMVIAVGNDRQFAKFANILGMSELMKDDRFNTNTNRIKNKKDLIQLITPCMKLKRASEWQKELQDVGIPNGPINDMEALFNDKQVLERDMVVEMSHPTAENIKLVGSPLKLSRTPAEIRRHPPLFGEHTKEVLGQLGYTEPDIKEMEQNRII
jgi:crotonobetainyl-CoA:carnitine CoA-transferase CaiB-like acyl-CoA transferase